MRRILFVLNFLVLSGAVVFGQYQNGHGQSKNGSGQYGHSEKMDRDLNDRYNTGHSTDRVRFIVQRTTPPTASDNDDITNNGGKVVRQYDQLKYHVVEAPVSVAYKLTNNPKVKYVSIDEPVRAQAGGEPNVVSGAALARQTYWVTGKGIGVAVIDSGIASHPDLTVAKAVDFVDSSRTGGYDPFGHGTHVAGIIAGTGAAAYGMHKGIASGVNLVDLRVLDQNGAGYTSDVMAAINWAIANRNSNSNNGKNLNIRVINLSMGHPPHDTTDNDPLTQACRKAVENGIIVVTSAGNHGKDSLGNVVYGSITSPGNEPSVITVGAMTTWGTDDRSDDTVATYSSRGPTAREHRMKPDLVAPGSHVISTSSTGSYLATSYPQLISNTRYLSLSGTSMAAPVVAGAVALILEKNPALTPNAVKAILMFTAEQRNVPNPALTVGAGYINVAGAVNLAANVNPSAPVGQSWLINGGAGLNYNNTIAGTGTVWSQMLNWGTRAYATNAALYNCQAWGQTIIWDDTIVWDQSIVSGQTIVWDETIVWDQTIIWDETIVWGQTIVWDE